MNNDISGLSMKVKFAVIADTHYDYEKNIPPPQYRGEIAVSTAIRTKPCRTKDWRPPDQLPACFL